MSIGTIFFVIAAVLFFLAAVKANFIPDQQIWGLFFIALGLVCGGIPLRYPWDKTS